MDNLIDKNIGFQNSGMNEDDAWLLMLKKAQTKLFNAYGVILERVTNQFQNWVNSLNAMDGYNSDDRIKEDVAEEKTAE